MVEIVVPYLAGAVDDFSESAAYLVKFRGELELRLHIEKLGFGAAVHQNTAKVAAPNKQNNTAAMELAEMRRRLTLSLAFTAPLFYLHMGLMYGWPLPEIVKGQENLLLASIVQLFFCLPVVIAGYKYFYHGLRNLFNRAPNMDSLIAIGSGAAFV